jgi:hypothetical protein
MQHVIVANACKAQEMLFTGAHEKPSQPNLLQPSTPTIALYGAFILKYLPFVNEALIIGWYGTCLGQLLLNLSDRARRLYLTIYFVPTSSGLHHYAYGRHERSLAWL